ncbi:MAG: hypothetical protein NTV19_20805, partial [Burkholderiales bacterium]|nr:hypothetical protein [Burkholderiales bacterium]
MTETAQPGGDNPEPVPTHADGLPTDGQPIIAARALAGPATVNRAARTVEVVWSTGARARNFVPPLGLITEELDMSPSAVRMDGLRGGGAPVLNTHRSNDARDVVGRVLDARIEAGRGVATLQFSSATDVEPLWQRVADGTLRSVSVGYRVHRYVPIQDPVAGTVHRAVDWEPYEISVVPIPVDPAAAVRGDGDQPPAAAAIEPALTSLTSPTPVPASQETLMPDPTNETTTAVPHAAAPAPTATATATATAPTEANRGGASIADAVAEALRADRERNAALNTVLTASRGLISAPVGDALHQRALTEGWTPDAFRSALWDAMLQGAKPPSIPASPASPAAATDDPAVIREAMAEALAVRTMPGYQAPAGSTRHAEFLGWRPSEMVAELMRARGERNIPRDTAKLAERAFHTTSDFPLLLSAAANKMLLAAYQPANPTYRQIFLRRDFRDFKPHRHLRVGDFPNLVALSENGEIQAGTVSESQELVAL